MKPFYAHLLENEETFEYKLVSVENIHTDDVMSKIRLALGKYGLVTLEPNGVLTTVKDSDNKRFAEYPFAPIYLCKITMNNPVSSNPLIQSIALFTRIKDTKLKLFDNGDKIVMDGSDAEQHAHPMEVGGKDAQSEVGQAKADSLVSDMMMDIAGRRDKNIIRDVYEGHTASHVEISKMINTKVPRGFYLIENTANDRASITGPFKTCPDNFGYITNVNKAVVLSESSDDGVVEYAVKYAEPDMQNDPADAGTRDRNKPMEVALIDQDSGKEHTVVVRADTDESARLKAVEIIAKRTGLHKDRFMPKDPS
jgi:hypothetical protein